MVQRILIFLLAGLPLAAQQQTGRLKVHAGPSRAAIFLDGKYIGPAGNFGFARTYTVAAGEHEMKLTEPRCQDVTKKITVTAGKTLKVSETLTRLPEPKGPFGILKTGQPDKYAPVFVNGKYMGHADEFDFGAQGLLLPPGEYTVRIEPTSGAAIEKKVTLEAGKTAVVR
jgi:hypothetical protein